MTPQARSSAAFELLRFTAAPVTGALVVLELEGRFRQSTRFGRQPVLVIEPGGDAARIELTPVRTAVDGRRWEAAYAVPAEALSGDATLALGVRGTLLELPPPDEPDDGERLTALARDANRLRRTIEAAETDAQAARDEAAAVTAERDAAVATARQEATAASAERIDALEHEVVEAHRLAASDAATARAETEVTIAAAIADVTTRAETAEQHAEQAESRARDAEQRLAAAEEARQSDVAAAEARAAKAEEALGEAGGEGEIAAANARLTEVQRLLRTAEARVVELETGGDAGDESLTTEMAAVIDAQARAAEAEEKLQTVRQRAEATARGIDVLRAELAEERERSRVTVAELEQELDAARARADALRHAAAAEGLWPATADEDEDVEPRGLWAGSGGAANGDAAPDDDETRVLHSVGSDDPVDSTRPFTFAEQRDADADTTQPFGATERRPPREATLRDLIDPPGRDADGGANPGRWVALAALVLFAFVLLGLLLGFLP